MRTWVITSFIERVFLGRNTASENLGFFVAVKLSKHPYVLESNLGNTGKRQVLSPLHHPCPPSSPTPLILQMTCSLSLLSKVKNNKIPIIYIILDYISILNFSLHSTARNGNLERSRHGMGQSDRKVYCITSLVTRGQLQPFCRYDNKIELSSKLPSNSLWGSGDCSFSKIRIETWIALNTLNNILQVGLQCVHEWTFVGLKRFLLTGTLPLKI